MATEPIVPEDLALAESAPEAIREATPADVIQVDPSRSVECGGALLIVQSSNELGVRAVLFVPTERGKVKAEYVRLAHGDYVVIGKARWTRF